MLMDLCKHNILCFLIDFYFVGCYTFNKRRRLELCKLMPLSVASYTGRETVPVWFQNWEGVFLCFR